MSPDPAAVVAALSAVDGTVDVVGSGPLAAELRRLLVGRAPAPDASPAAVVDTTGEPSALRSALERVATLGTVVLAGPEPVAPLCLDLYGDLHVRGLVLVGLASDGG